MGLTYLKWSANSGAAALLAFACATGVFAQGNKENVAKVTGETKTPLVVLIHSRECPVCAKVRPIIKELSATYEPRVRFVNLDVTDDKAKAQSKLIAKSLRVGAFFNMYADTFPCVGVFDSKDQPVHELCGFNAKQKYEGYIKRALEKS